ncbi:MAG: MFS transporter [Actinomycetales bacterium]|nr:MFS transporter [Actinomycetales bacterium]
MTKEHNSDMAAGIPTGPFGEDGHPKRWAILGVLVVSLLIVVLDNTVLNIALPTIQHDLDATQSELLWAVDSYQLVFAALLFTWGVLGDTYGRKKILLIGLAIFMLASAACAFATSPSALIWLRAIMGIGGAAVTPVTLAIITVVFPPRERGKAIGTWAAAVGGAVALGPILGGLLLENPSWTNGLTGNNWGSVFLINVPIVIIGIIGIIRVVPETKNPNPQKLDIPGLLISIAGLVALVYGIIHAGTIHKFIDKDVLGWVAVGLGLLALFFYLEKRSDHKSFDVTLFSNRPYAISLTAVSLAFFALSGITFTLPFYLQVVRDYSTLMAGLAFVPFALGQIVSAPRSAKMVAKFGNRNVMTFGLILVGLALAGMTQLREDTPIWAALVAFFCFGAGMGNVIAPASTVMQNALPMSRAGSGSAVQNTVRQVFGALGVATLGTILATTYANNLAPTLAALPNIPEQAKEALRSTVAAVPQAIANAQSNGMPADKAEAFRTEAFAAFTDASHKVAAISATIVFLVAILVITQLPKNLGKNTETDSATSPTISE